MIRMRGNMGSTDRLRRSKGYFSRESNDEHVIWEDAKEDCAGQAFYGIGGK